MPLANLYRIYGKSNILLCSNGVVYRRLRETSNWVFLFASGVRND